MTVQEFSNEFDILYNEVMSNQSPGLDEYEKSVFLTLAQEEIVRAYFNILSNTSYQGYDDNAKRQYDFSALTKVTELVCLSDILDGLNIDSIQGPIVQHLDRRGKLYVFPSDFFLTVNEQVTDSSGRIYSVIPISFSDYRVLTTKPYNYPLKREVWRLYCDSTSYYNSFGIFFYENTSTSENFFVTLRGRYYKPILVNLIITEDESAAPEVLEVNNIIYIRLQVNIEDITTYGETYLFTTSDSYSLIENYLYGIDEYGSWYSNLSDTTEVLGTHIIYVNSNQTSNGVTLESPIVEIIGRYKGSIKYKIRYVKMPTPIILTDLSEIEDTLSIRGYNEAMECELPIGVHTEIVSRAVELAKAYYSSEAAQSTPLTNIMSLRTNSITDVGKVSPPNKQ